MSHPNTGVLASPSWHYCDQPGLYFQKQVPRTGTCRGVVDPVCCTWGHGEFPLAWDSKPPAHPTPYTLLPTGRNQGMWAAREPWSAPPCPAVQIVQEWDHGISHGEHPLHIQTAGEHFRWGCWRGQKSVRYDTIELAGYEVERDLLSPITYVCSLAFPPPRSMILCLNH